MRVSKIYWAAPLFTEEEKVYNEQCVRKLESAGFGVYLPQRDGGEYLKGVKPEDIYRKDIEALEQCDMLIGNIKGNDPGTLFEIGYAAALGKTIQIVGHTDNCMFVHIPQFDSLDISSVGGALCNEEV